MTTPTMFELNNVTKIFDSQVVLNSITLSIAKGEKIALVGPSGAGKTTLLNLLANALKPDSGTIHLDQTLSYEQLSNKAQAKKVGMIRQQYDLVMPLTVINNVLAGKLSDWSFFKTLLSLIVPQEKHLAQKALDRVGLENKTYERTSNLSGGEQQRVALARLLVQNPDAILADEPVSSLDPARAEDILKLLVSITGENSKTLIASLHSVNYAIKYFDRVIGIKDGNIHFDLPSSNITENHLNELYTLKGQQAYGTLSEPQAI